MNLLVERLPHVPTALLNHMLQVINGAVGYGIGVGVGHLYKYSRSQKLMANGEKPIEKGISMFDIVILLILSVLIFQLGMYMMS